MKNSSGYLLLGDIGGSNARFAVSEVGGTGFESVSVVPCADFPSLEQAIDNYLEEHSFSAPAAICLAAAGPLLGQTIQLTNNGWIANARALSARFGGIPVQLMNDFEALAWSLAKLDSTDLETVGDAPVKGAPRGDFTVAVIGPGTGLGMAGLISRSGVLLPVVGEGGQVGFAPENDLQARVLQHLSKQYGRVSVERMVSGDGLESIYQALCELSKHAFSKLTAADIFAATRAGRNEMARQSVELFFELLGQSAGNLALTIGAIDGVYIAGGIVPRYPELLYKSKFRYGFENKGRYRRFMEQIPTQLIVHPQPGLLGAAFCAQQLIDSVAMNGDHRGKSPT